LFAKAAWDQHLDGLAEKLLAVIAEEHFGLRVNESNQAAFIDDDGRVGSVFQKRKAAAGQVRKQKR
jgi:hypothetical protein